MEPGQDPPGETTPSPDRRRGPLTILALVVVVPVLTFLTLVFGSGLGEAGVGVLLVLLPLGLVTSLMAARLHCAMIAREHDKLWWKILWYLALAIGYFVVQFALSFAGCAVAVGFH